MFRLERSARFERGKDEGDDYVVEMAFASEEPYQRWWGIEILDCSEKAVRLDRLNDDAPLLFNHRWDQLRGVHVRGSVRCDADKVVRGKVRLTSATQDGRDTIQLVKTKVLTKTSVGYEIHKVIEISTKKDGSEQRIEHDGRMFQRVLKRCHEEKPGDIVAFFRALDSARGEQIERGSDDPPTFLVIDWEPYEDSLVTVPADSTVGVGRSAEATEIHQPAISAARSMTMQEAAPAVLSAEEKARQEAAERERATTAERERQATRELATKHESDRIAAIKNIAAANKIGDNIRDHWVATGASMREVSDDLVKILEQRGKDNPQSIANLGLTEKETKKFSLFRAVKAAADKDWTGAGFELECSKEIAKRLDRVPDPKTFFVPHEVQLRALGPQEAQAAKRRLQQRDISVGAGGGAYLVETANVGFIELLRNRSVAMRMGATRLGGLVGNVTIPRQSAAATAAWLTSETATITESAQTIQQLSLSPKTVGAYTEVSRQLMLQSSPDAEGLVTADLAAVAGLAVDVGVLRGSGASGEPTGIVNTSGIGAVTGTSLGYAGIIEFQTDVATANVMPARGGYVTTPAVAGLMKQRARFSNTDTPLWEGNVWDGTIEGFPAMSSLQMSSATMLFGAWESVILAEWGVLQVDVNPFANFQAAIIGIRAIVTVDVGLRYPAAFSYASSIT